MKVAVVEVTEGCFSGHACVGCLARSSDACHFSSPFFLPQRWLTETQEGTLRFVIQRHRDTSKDTLAVGSTTSNIEPTGHWRHRALERDLSRVRIKAACLSVSELFRWHGYSLTERGTSGKSVRDVLDLLRMILLGLTVCARMGF